MGEKPPVRYDKGSDILTKINGTTLWQSLWMLEKFEHWKCFIQQVHACKKQCFLKGVWRVSSVTLQVSDLRSKQRAQERERERERERESESESESEREREREREKQSIVGLGLLRWGRVGWGGAITFKCICVHVWCYAVVRSLARRQTYDATLRMCYVMHMGWGGVRWGLHITLHSYDVTHHATVGMLKRNCRQNMITKKCK